ncbi:uncharacterized protein LOC141838166 [Curcuma longa]|uniref:uncharacterized protein LOC141838166 n=1 Tax=Curcuma longa TaxID=136217 RepID=UPI003D9F3997
MPKKRKAAKRKKTAVATADLPAKDNGNQDGRAPPQPEEIKENDGGSTASSSSASSSPREHHCSRPAEEFSGSETVAFDGSTEGVVLVQNDEEESSVVVKEATFSSTTESFPKSKDSIVEATKYQEEHEEAVDESAVPFEKIVVLAEEERQVDEIALAEVQVKVVLLPDADETAKQLNESHGDRCCGGRDETLPAAELTLPPPVVVVGRTSWWSCCGLLDVFAGSG